MQFNLVQVKAKRIRRQEIIAIFIAFGNILT